MGVMTAGDFKQSTNLNGKVLASGQLAGGATTVYTVPTGAAVKLATASLTNVTAATAAVTVSVVPSGQAIDATRVVLSGYPLAPHDTISAEDVLNCLKGAMLEAGALVQVTVPGGSQINYLLTGAVSN
jgi:hypothetical protein